MKRPGYGLIVALLVAGSAGCAAESNTATTTPATLAFETTKTTLIDGPPNATFSGAEGDLIDFHSSWICEFQRRTFVNPEAGEQALSEALVAADIGGAVYESFLNRLASSQDLRDAVLFDYQETCRG